MLIFISFYSKNPEKNSTDVNIDNNNKYFLKTNSDTEVMMLKIQL